MPPRTPSPTPRMVDPVSILPLLDCLHCRALVSSPVTLFCGHTLCASHILTNDGHDAHPGQTLRASPVDPPSAASASAGDGDDEGGSVAARATAATSDRQAGPLARSRPNGPPIHILNSVPIECPLATCTVLAQPSQPQQQPQQPVVAYPTLTPSPIHPDIRTDSRISNITALVTRAVAAVAAVAALEPLEAIEPAAPSADLLSPFPDPAPPEHVDNDSDNESLGCTHTDTDPEPNPPRPLPILQPRSPSSTPPPSCPPLTSLSRRRHSPPNPTHSAPSPPRKRRKTEKYGTLTSTDPAPTTPTPNPAATKLERELLELLTCEICFTLLYEPITTPCQHTFCTRCLQRTLDHSVKCPLCRQDFSNVGYFHNHPHNKMLSTIILTLYPDALKQRIETINQEERDPRLDTPVFVFQLSFPGIPTNLHIFEPRYRLMLRRCLQMSTPRFGMVISPQDDGGLLNNFGTMLEIRNVRVLADGRSIVETNGAYRFRIIERKILDGYMVARVERFDDIPPELEREVERTAVASVVTHSTTMQVIPSIHRSQRPPNNVVAPPPRVDDRPASTSSAPSTSTAATSNSESTPSTPHVATVVSKYPVEPATATLVRKCHDFLEKLRSNPMVVQRLNNIGPVPEDIGLFTFYVASVVPIDEHEKAKLLPIRSPRLRLRLVVHWIEQLEQHWWFQGAGCTAM